MSRPDLYSPRCVEGLFSEVLGDGVLGSSPRIHRNFIASSYHAQMERTGEKVRSGILGAQELPQFSANAEKCLGKS